jgi:hypothetical protein
MGCLFLPYLEAVTSYLACSPHLCLSVVCVLLKDGCLGAHSFILFLHLMSSNRKAYLFGTLHLIQLSKPLWDQKSWHSAWQEGKM